MCVINVGGLVLKKHFCNNSEVSVWNFNSLIWKVRLYCVLLLLSMEGRVDTDKRGIPILLKNKTCFFFINQVCGLGFFYFGWLGFFSISDILYLFRASLFFLRLPRKKR